VLLYAHVGPDGEGYDEYVIDPAFLNGKTWLRWIGCDTDRAAPEESRGGPINCSDVD
jgi:hypothetical protein